MVIVPLLALYVWVSHRIIAGIAVGYGRGCNR